MSSLKPSLSLLAVALLAAACADAPDSRALTGRAPAGTRALEAVDTEGKSFAAVLDQGDFRVVLDTKSPVELYVIDADDTRRVMKFQPTAGAPATRSILPAFEGTVALAQLQECDCDGDGHDAEVTPEHNPLEQIDSDHDGASDLDDAHDEAAGDVAHEDDHHGDVHETDADGEHAVDAPHDEDADGAHEEDAEEAHEVEEPAHDGDDTQPPHEDGTGDAAAPCGDGMVHDDTGACVPHDDGTQACPDGMMHDDAGACVHDDAAQPCADGTVHDDTGACVPHDDETQACPDGTVHDDAGACVHDDPPMADCPAGAVHDAAGACVCADGMVENDAGECVHA